MSCVNRFFRSVSLSSSVPWLISDRDSICDEDWARAFFSRRARIWIGPPSQLTCVPSTLSRNACSFALGRERYFYCRPSASLEEAFRVNNPVEQRGIFLIGGTEPCAMFGNLMHHIYSLLDSKLPICSSLAPYGRLKAFPMKKVSHLLLVILFSRSIRPKSGHIPAGHWRCGDVSIPLHGLHCLKWRSRK